MLFYLCKEDSGFVPLLVYGLFGSSRQLAIGLVALVSLLCSNVLSSIANPSSKLYTAGNTIGSYG
ncbi:putative sulfate transporter 4 [Arachis hypogaea]|nr:putative sulfate transporter 4 [Arachis hypogaea]